MAMQTVGQVRPLQSGADQVLVAGGGGHLDLHRFLRELRDHPVVERHEVGNLARQGGIRLRELRQAGLAAQMEFEGRSIKAQMKRADRLGARVTLILGADELARGEVTLRDMRGSEQRAIARADVIPATRALLEGQ